MMADQLDAVESRQIAATSLRTFMRLPVAQRSSVILMDVLGCSLKEICEIMATACRRPRPRCIAAARSCGKSPASRTIRRSRDYRMPIARGSAPMSRISTRATSTRSAP